MSTIKQYPAMRGKLGSTEYYTFVAKAMDLAASTAVKSPDDWKNMTIDELTQRKLDIRRVVKHIAPYMAKDKDRFFGAVVIATDKDPEFTPFTGLLAGQKLNPMFRPFQKQLDTMGMLSLDGSEEWNPLDGQHRIEALRCAITGKDRNGKTADFAANRELGEEDVTVIMIPNCSTAKARKIFTKINRHARKTAPGDNLLMDDDDIVAVLTRDISSEIFGGRLINMSKPDIGGGERYFTTLKSMEQANMSIIRYHYKGGDISRTELPPEPVRRLLERTIREVWKHLADNIPLFADALSDKSEKGDKKRIELRETFLLLKPVPQMAMADAFARLTGQGQPSQPLTFQQATDRLNKIDWKLAAPCWDRVLMSGGKILPKKGKLAGELIYYWAGGKLKPQEEAALLEKYRKEFPEDAQPQKLPPKVA